MNALKGTVRLLVVAAATAASTGCGPSISETRMVYAPPLPESCDVKVVNVQLATVSMNPDYEMLGSIIVQSASHEDPFNEELLSKVRPRVCKMGGDNLSLGMATNVAGGGSGVVYTVLKARAGATPPTEAPPAAGEAVTSPAAAPPADGSAAKTP